MEVNKIKKQEFQEKTKIIDEILKSKTHRFKCKLVFGLARWCNVNIKTIEPFVLRAKGSKNWKITNGKWVKI